MAPGVTQRIRQRSELALVREKLEKAAASDGSFREAAVDGGVEGGTLGITYKVSARKPSFADLSCQTQDHLSTYC
jgi:hypothetical protein